MQGLKKFEEISYDELMEVDGGIAWIPLIVGIGVQILDLCSPTPLNDYGTNGGTSYNDYMNNGYYNN